MALMNQQNMLICLVALIIVPFNNIAFLILDSRGKNFKFLLPFAIQLGLIWFLWLFGIGATIAFIYSLVHTVMIFNWNRKKNKDL